MDTSEENSQDSVELDDNQVLAAMQKVEFFTVPGPESLINGHQENNGDLQAFVEIVEQPQQRGFRFRYECEGPSHGGLQGEKTERGHKTHPSIRVVNYNGPAHFEVSLVTDEANPIPHAHKLVGKNCKDGICVVDVQSTANIISFPNLCVLHVTRKKAGEVFLSRILEQVKRDKQMRANNMGLQPNITADESQNAKKRADDQARSISLNVVRLCFKTFLPDHQGQFTHLLAPVYSQPIYDSKSPGASALKICRMDKYGGCCTGNEEVFLLCEKVQKEDISVRFVELNEDQTVKWEAFGNFSPLDVHRQYAIVFKTPAYYNANIDKAVNVLIMLQRKSDCDVSEAKAFTYYPQNKDKDLIARKRRKKLPLDASFYYYGGGDDDGPGGGAPGGGSGGGLGGFGPPSDGPDGGSCGGGGIGGPSQFNVMLPNGSIVAQNVLPKTVEQVVKEEYEEYARSHTESPDQTSADDSDPSPLAIPLDPMLWSGPLSFDLDIDAAPVSIKPSVTRQTLPPSIVGKVTSSSCPDLDFDSKIVSKKESPNLSHQSSASSDFQAKSVTCDIIVSSGEELLTDIVNSSVWNDKKESQPLITSDKPAAQASLGKTDKVAAQSALGIDEAALDTLKNSATLCGSSEDSTLAVSSIVSDFSKNSSGIVIDIPDSQDSVLSEGQSASVGRDSSLDDVLSLCTKYTPSESQKTDEGFSEVIEESSVKDLPIKRKIQPVTTTISAKNKVKESNPHQPVKTASAVIKRIMEKITARTIRALEEFAETGDVRHLLIIQRHLTAVKNENGDLPIHLAVINYQPTALQQLVDVMCTIPNSRATINTYNYIRQTALHIAAIMHQPLAIEMLLHGGADPALADRNGNTPAHLAVLNNSYEAMRALVKYLRPGVTASKPFPELNYLNYDGYTPVHLAAQNGNVDLLKLLVYGRANVNIPDGKSGRSALHHAVELDDLPVAGYLLMEANAAVNARSFDGNTPLHIACGRGLVGMVALLMTAGANPDIENEEIPSEDEDSQFTEYDEVDRGNRRCRRGLQPVDYAGGNEKILRVLKGDQYLNEGTKIPEEQDIVEHTLEGAHSVFDSGLEDPLSGDMDHLSYATRVELSHLLDQVHAGKDVLTLAARLGYDNLVTGLEVMGGSGTSPTRFLLDYHETSFGTVSKLKECLKALGREDAVELINSAFRSQVKEKQLQHTRIDSGVGSDNARFSN